MLEDRIYSAAEILAIPPRLRVTKSSKSGIELLQGNGYFIEWSRLNSPLKLAIWIRHLVDKNWVDKDTITDLMDATERHFHWDIQGGDA